MWALKPSVALRKYCWVIVRSIAYGDKNKLQFAPQACVLMDNFSDSMEAVYAVTLVPSINAGMLGKRGGCRGSSAVHWGPATAKSPKSERDAEQEVWNSQRSERCSVWVRVASDCPRYRDPSVYSCITLEVVGPGEGSCWKASGRTAGISSIDLRSWFPLYLLQYREGRFIFMQFTVMLRGWFFLEPRV